MSDEPPAIGQDLRQAIDLEIYKALLARLQFQDEYLFKFSALFMTLHGALAVASKAFVFDPPTPQFGNLTLISAGGIFLAVVWMQWIQQNDFWHSHWTYRLRLAEQTFQSKIVMLNTDVYRDAQAREKPIPAPIRRGHDQASMIPKALALIWLGTFGYSTMRWLECSSYPDARACRPSPVCSTSSGLRTAIEVELIK